MAIIQIRYNPAFDASQLAAFFKKQFQDKYEVYCGRKRQSKQQACLHGYPTVVIVKKNWFCGAFVLVEQQPNTISIKVWSDFPSEGFFQASVVLWFILALVALPFVLMLVTVPFRTIISDPITAWAIPSLLVLFIILIRKFLSSPIITDVLNSLKQVQ
jgi:hypothetical protein